MAACLLFPQRDITEYAGKDGAQVRSCSASFDTPREPVLKLAGVPQEMAERVEISRCIDAPYIGCPNLVSHRSIKRESSGASLWSC